MSDIGVKKMFQHSNFFKQLFRTIKRISHTYYPNFIFGLPTKQDQIPVFVYHDVDAQDFETDLQFLKVNGYHTVSIDELLKNDNRASQKTVLLTFDDARRNFWETAFPLIKKYNAQATIFLPTLWARHQSFPQIEKPAGSDGLFMNWKEIAACENSDFVKVESHGYRHALVYNSKSIETFATPDLLKKYDIFDWPMRSSSNNDILGQPKLGTPVYSAKPLLSSNYRIIEDDRLSEACQNLVDDGGGKEFFKKNNWADLLRKMYLREYKNGRGFRKIEKKEFSSQIKNEFILSANEFEENLNTRPRYFAYPWELGTNFSIRFAAEMGIRAVFGVGKDYSRIRHQREDIPCFYRIKGDWLRFLPGKGRKRFRKVMFQKIINFQKIQHLAH